MKSMAAVLLSALLCVQPVSAIPVCAMPERKVVLYEDTQEKTGGQNVDTQKEAGRQSADMQKEAGGQNVDTQERDAGKKTDGQDHADAKDSADVQKQDHADAGRRSGGQDHADTQDGSDVQEDIDTQGEVESAGEDEEGEASIEAETQEETGEQSQNQDNGAGGMTVSAPSAILMEASTGQVIFEKDADTQRPPASVTKVMTLLLIFDALNDGKISLEDTVTTSEYAASMGGSQVFLEPGETQTVDTMIKCISVASANDACVAFKNSRQMHPAVYYGLAGMENLTRVGSVT